MRKLQLLCLLSTLILIFSCGSDDTEQTIPEDPTGPSTSSPNILLIIADDMGLDATPGYTEGIEKPNMPNLEAMIASGVRFQNFWAAPVCTPTRASILTGRYGVQTGILGVGDEIGLSETSVQRYMDNNGSDYSHALVGKWHLSNDANNPTDMGIGHYAGLLTGGVQSYTNWQLTENGSTASTTEYSTTKFTDLAIEWVSDQSNPWFLWLAYNAPHTPFHLPPAHLHSQGDLPADQASIDANPTPYYLAALEAMDTEMGRLLSSISAEELANTIVIFVGDNGTPNQVAQAPYSRRRAKGTLYQGGVNVPMIVSGAGVSRLNEVETALVNSTDLFATIATLAGAPDPQLNTSQSLVDLLSTSDNSFRDFAYTDMNQDGNAGYTIRNQSYKLIVIEGADQELYNMSTDPYESTNLMDGDLSAAETTAYNSLVQAAAEIRN